MLSHSPGFLGALPTATVLGKLVRSPEGMVGTLSRQISPFRPSGLALYQAVAQYTVHSLEYTASSGRLTVDAVRAHRRSARNAEARVSV